MILTHSLPLQAGFKRLRIDRSTDDKHWRVWLMADRTHSIGTYAELHDDGSMLLTTQRSDGMTETIELKEQDK